MPFVRHPSSSLSLSPTCTQAYAPEGVWRTYRQWGGQDPIDIREQMDVHDFFDSLCDQVDETLKRENKEPVFQGVFGLEIDEEKVVKSGCSHRFSKVQGEMGLKVQVRNQPDLKTSLELWGKGELLEDYKVFMRACVPAGLISGCFCHYGTPVVGNFAHVLTIRTRQCEECKEKRNILKRPKIKKLPNTLIIQLKR